MSSYAPRNPRVLALATLNHEPRLLEGTNSADVRRDRLEMDPP